MTRPPALAGRPHMHRALTWFRAPGHWTLPVAALLGGFLGGSAGYLLATTAGL